jgi:hypothetical protein
MFPYQIFCKNIKNFYTALRKVQKYFKIALRIVQNAENNLNLGMRNLKFFIFLSKNFHHEKTPCTICLPWQYLQEPDGGIYSEGYGRESWKS